jgi:pimeloyl-ACP methyl ester carboxylesterase
MVIGICFILLSSNVGLNYSPVAYSQSMNSSFQAEVNAIDNMPAQKVRVGDIDIAYKQFGKRSDIPIVLIAGGGVTMDMWNQTLLKDLSNQTVIIFDNRGAGESSIGRKEYSITQLANDTAGLLDALKIDKADVLDHSIGSFIAQELALMNPDRINSLVLSGSSCGGKDAVPPSPEVIQAFANSMNSSSPIQEEDYQSYMPIPEESVSQVLKAQFEAIENWNSTCNNLSNITKPTLVIVGTEDTFTPAPNSLMIVNKIHSSDKRRGSWINEPVS